MTWRKSRTLSSTAYVGKNGALLKLQPCATSAPRAMVKRKAEMFMPLGVSTMWTFKRSSLFLVLCLVLGACIVSDKDLPCRRDCQCPASQWCNNGICKPGNAPGKDPQTEGGSCGNGCPGTLRCYPDGCGGDVCRERCNPLAPSCEVDRVCEDVRTEQPNSGGGGMEGVCVP